MSEDLMHEDVPLVMHRRRGLVRIVLGGLGMALGITGLLMMATVAALVATVIAPLTAAPVSFGSTSDTLEVSASATYYVYVPSTEVTTAACSVDGEEGVSWTSRTIDLPAHIVDVEYTQIGTLTVASDQTVTVSCQGVTDVAVTTLGMLGTTIVFSSLALCALALLVSGIRAHRRTRRRRVFAERL